MASTYTPIATYTAPSAQSSYTFSSIPNTYTDLILVCNVGLSTPYDLTFRLNGDTGTNYSSTFLYGTGSAAGSARVSSSYTFNYLDYYGAPNGTVGTTNQILHVMNYANTNTYKTSLVRANSASGGTDAIVNLWRSTAAINSIQIYGQGSGNLLTGSTLTLYGIKAA